MRPPDAPASSARSTIATRVALAAAASLLALALAEVSLRAAGVRPFPDWSARGLHAADDELGVVPAPDADVVQETEEFSVRIRTDASGLRSGARPADASPRILLVGDSFAFGHGVSDEEVVSARLEARLREAGLERAWVANAAVSSYGVSQAVGRLRRLAPAIRPDARVLLLFEANDPFDELREPLTVDEVYLVARGEEVSLARKLRLWFKHRSAVYRVLVDALFSPGPPTEIAGNHPAFGFDLFRDEPTPAAARALAATDAALEAFRVASAEQGARPLVATPQGG